MEKRKEEEEKEKEKREEEQRAGERWGTRENHTIWELTVE